MYLLYQIFSLLTLTYLLLNLYLLHLRSKYRHFPSPPLAVSWSWFMGHLPDLMRRKSRSPHKNFAQLTSEYNADFNWDMLRLSFFNENVLFCMDLSVVPKVMTDPTAFPKDTNLINGQRRVMRVCGEKTRGIHNILSLPGGDIWRAKRRILDPAFKKSFLRTTMEGMNKVARDLVEVLENKKEDEVFDISENLNTSAMEAVSVCGFDWGDDLIQKHGQNALDLASVLVEIMAVAIKQPFEFSLPWNSRSLKDRYKKVSSTIRQAMKEHLTKRMENDRSGDILSHIIRSNSCSDDLGIDDLVEEYIVFLLAGMETTAITMATVVHFLTLNPDVCRKVQDEVDEVFEGQEELAYDDVAKLVFLENVIKESLRMKGPVHGTWRVCQNDNVIIEGIHIPKHTRVYIPFEVLQNDPRYWENPMVFNPSRFTGESGKSVRPFTYMPFSAGLRNCIGRNFAMLEMKVVLANVFRKFSFWNPHPDLKDPPRMGNLTLRPMNGVPVKRFYR